MPQNVLDSDKCPSGDTCNRKCRPHIGHNRSYWITHELHSCPNDRDRGAYEADPGGIQGQSYRTGFDHGGNRCGDDPKMKCDGLQALDQ
ncbi:hypothetical protein D3C71_2057380 [compost metagenome]